MMIIRAFIDRIRAAAREKQLEGYRIRWKRNDKDELVIAVILPSKYRLDPPPPREGKRRHRLLRG